MPQAVKTFTVPLRGSPEGILEEMCCLETVHDRIVQMADRCKQAAELLYFIQKDGALHSSHRDALTAVEVMLRETGMLALGADEDALLQVVAA